MHETLIEDVLGYIQEYTLNDDKITVNGWCFHKTQGLLPLRLLVNYEANLFANNESCIFYPRPDVSEFYKNNDIVNCGFTIDVKLNDDMDAFKLEAEIDGQWLVVFDFMFYDISPKRIPSFVVVDDFYNYPDKVRDFALKQPFIAHPDYHKGKRTDMVYRFPNLKTRFESILGNKIVNWKEHGVNCCFQSCIAGEQLVYHFDTQQYAGILFLTPDAPPEAGTTFYRSKHTKNMKVDGDYDKVFRTGVLDPSQFDVVDVVGNRYNRLVLFDAQMIHAASSYFGNDLQNGRLFQLFFFDLE